MSRYFILHEDQFEEQYPDLAKINACTNGNNFRSILMRRDPGGDKFVGCDAMEPEDATFYRDMAWLVDELNRLNEECL